MRRRSLVVLLGLAVALLPLLPDGKLAAREYQGTTTTPFGMATATDEAGDQRYRVVIPYGQSDQEALALLPDLDLELIAQSHPSSRLPIVEFTDDLHNDGALHQVGSIVEISGALDDISLPDTLLLYSGDWYGDKLGDAAKNMSLNLIHDQLRYLETVSASRAINTRLLLTLAKVKNAPNKYKTPQEWLNWLYLEASRIRTSLGPYSEDDV